MDIQKLVSEAFNDRSLLKQDETVAAVWEAMKLLDCGELRVAEKDGDSWRVNEWAKHAILLLFSVAEMEVTEVGPYVYHDKIPLKRDFAEQGVRVVPPATARFGSFMERGVVLMPSYVNLGAYIGANTMVDNWALVGSCAQIGANVHLSANVVIGGVLEPLNATPVIVEDGAFIGSGCSVVEGVCVEAEAVLGANVTLTSSTKIIDVTGSEPVEYKGRIPARSVVIPGTVKKSFPAGDYDVACALIIGKRSESTDRKTSLNDVLREFAVQV